ncbi:MAG: phenylalanine--tRNA ligase subunit beta [Phycisphaeraceae bacterium]
MNTSLDWLNDYLDRPCDAEEAERLLTGVGFPLDGQEQVFVPSGEADTVLDVEITSNRSDCLSHRGLAREVAAASDRTLRELDTALPDPAAGPVSELTSVANEDSELCPVYTARVIRGVKVGPSPDWLVDRLEAIGLRSVNNVVDITNFVLFETGQPLHAFDMNRLAERRIVVRRAKDGERFTAIDGTKHELKSSMLVIADAERPVAIAGVMGGLDSEVGGSTTDILLESAMFQPLSTRQTSRALKLASDSSYRFERGVDPRGVEIASRRAAKLILELAGGQLADGVIRVGEPEPPLTQLTLRPGRCNALLGTDLSAERQAELLDKLGLDPQVGPEAIRCTVPSYRLDLKREVDLIEEVARLHGLDQIAIDTRIEIEAKSMQPHVAARRELGRVLTGWGYHETVTFSFVSPKQGKPFLEQGEAVLIDDERRKAEPMLRPSLLPSLLVCRKANQDMGNTGVHLYEVGSTWTGEQGDIREVRRVGLLVDAEDAQAGVREIRGAIEELVERLGGPKARSGLEVKPGELNIYDAAAEVTLDGRRLGRFGLVTSKTRDLFDVKVPVAAGELELDPLLAMYPPQRRVGELPKYPAIERDLSVVVSEDVSWQQIAEAVESAKPDLLESLEFLGVYRGKGIEKGSKSVSLRMLFRSRAGTLRHEQVDPQVEAVVASLKEKTGAELRG